MKYIDVYEDIKRKINEGIYSPWSSLEGEEMLCSMYGISRTTIRKAIAKLKNESYVHSRQGSGIFVNPPEFYEEKNLTTLSEQIEDQSDIRNVILHFEIIPASQEIQALFKLTEQSEVIYYKRLRYVNDAPIVLEETYMPKHLFKDFTEDKARGSVSRYIEVECGFPLSHDIKNITAINIDQHFSDLLQLPIGTATLQIEHKVYLMKSVLAQFTRETQTNKSIRFVAVR
jgi:DNA-binding GntR family transcriptional regulator